MIDRSLLLAIAMTISSFTAPVWADADPDDESEDLPPAAEVPVEPAPPPEPEPVAAPEESVPVESAPYVEEAPAPVAEESSHKAYVGIDYVRGDLNSSVGATASTTRNTYEFDMLRLRGGVRFFEFLAAELQAGTSISGDDADKSEIDYYIGAFLVPHAVLFDTFELSFPVGVAKLEVQQGGLIFDDTDIAYGFQTDLPLRMLADVPDLRLGFGFMVYHAGNPSRTYGFNLGLRYDFAASKLAALNPMNAVRGLFGGGDGSTGSE